MTNKDVSVIVEKVKSGSTGAFEELYHSLFNSVYYVVRKQVSNHDDAMDIVQDVFLVVYQRIHTLKENEAFNSWLYRIAYNHCNNFLSRSRAQSTPLEDVEDFLFEDRESFLPEETLENKEIRSQIAQAVSELPEEQKQAILLFYYAGLSVREVAAAMNATENAVKIKLSRARVTLKNKMTLIMKGPA